MNRLLSKASPTLTNLIRMDHSAVMLAFHQYQQDAPTERKQAIIDEICVALEIHAQLENEILYPATRPLVDASLMDEHILPETEDVLRRIATLRSLAAGTPEQDRAFMELMREVIHHVAEEETRVLPAAESHLAAGLAELGAKMIRRRIELSKPHAGMLVRNVGRTLPPGVLVLSVGALVASLWAVSAGRRQH